MSVVALYWFDVQQKISTRKRQKSHSIYSKLNLELIDLTPSLGNAKKVI